MQSLTTRRARNRHPEPARPPSVPTWPTTEPKPRPSANHVGSAEVCRRFGLRPFSVQAVVHCAPVPRRWFAGRPMIDVREFAVALVSPPMARDNRANKMDPGGVRSARARESLVRALPGTKDTR